MLFDSRFRTKSPTWATVMVMGLLLLVCLVFTLASDGGLTFGIGVVASLIVGVVFVFTLAAWVRDQETVQVIRVDGERARLAEKLVEMDAPSRWATLRLFGSSPDDYLDDVNEDYTPKGNGEIGGTGRTAPGNGGNMGTREARIVTVQGEITYLFALKVLRGLRQGSDLGTVRSLDLKTQGERDMLTALKTELVRIGAITAPSGNLPGQIVDLNRVNLFMAGLRQGERVPDQAEPLRDLGGAGYQVG